MRRDFCGNVGLGCLLLLGASCAAQDSDAVRFDFESGDLQGWRVVDGSFGQLVCKRATFHNGGKAYNKQGTFYLSTLETPGNTPSDQFTGVVESPVFTLNAPAITLLVGGGQQGDTYVALCTLDGREVLKAQGANTEVMQRITWDAKDLVGKPVFVRVTDRNTGGWGHITLDDFSASGRIDPEASAKHFSQARSSLPSPAGSAGGSTAALRGAIQDLIKTFGERYPRGAEFLAKLEKLKDEEGDAFRALQREALIANPLVSGQPILYVARQQYPGDHHNTETMFQTDEINTGKYQGRGYLKTVDFANSSEVKVLLDPGPTSIPRDPELRFDGKQIVFSMRKNIKDNYHIYVIGADGSGLKQLTSAPGVFDIDPLYLADGDIAFTSSRDPKYCMCNRHIMGNLFKMKPDGANIHQLGRSTLFEGHGSLMPDGRIMYYRWEYVDRNFGDAQGLWVVNPDGTNHAIYWANNTGSPGGVIDAKIIPGTQLAICTFTSCHDRPWGAIAIIDRRKGIDTPEAVLRTWPASAKNLCSVTNSFDSFTKVTPKYEDPYPLSENYFLASKDMSGDKMAICLLDTFGNEVVLHTDEQGCFDPMPLGPRFRPETKPDMRDYKDAGGDFYVQDVYIGTHMQGIERGSVKYLRVVESPPKKNWTHPAWNGQGIHCPGMNWHNFENKRILGTVPVEADGSAHFECPSDKFVFFQLLDGNGMMVQSMRSGTMVQSGEKQGCVGCHENRVQAMPTSKKTPMALQRAASKLNGWYGEPRMFSFQKEVQPVFDKHCVKCHDFNKPAGDKLLLAGDRTICFNASYIDLWSKNVIRCVGAGPAETQQAKSWGSHPSRLIKVLREGHPTGTPGFDAHKDVKLSPEELDRVITWVDLNAPYYPYYESAYPNNPCGRSPIDDNQMKRLGQLTGAHFVMGHGGNQRTQVAFERPELSPCLQKLDKNSAQYKEALAIIQAGKEQLQKVPRADMDGFVPCEKDRQRLEKYDRRVQIEAENRKAILEGKKLYDKDFDRP
jgi:hypothetical protein